MFALRVLGFGSSVLGLGFNVFEFGALGVGFLGLRVFGLGAGFWVSGWFRA